MLVKKKNLEHFYHVSLEVSETAALRMVVFLCLAAINILAYANTRQLEVHQGCRILNYPGTLSRNLKVGYGTNKEVCFDPQEDIFYCPGDSVCCPERRECCPKYHPLCVGPFCCPEGAPFVCGIYCCDIEAPCCGTKCCDIFETCCGIGNCCDTTETCNQATKECVKAVALEDKNISRWFLVGRVEGG